MANRLGDDIGDYKGNALTVEPSKLVANEEMSTRITIVAQASYERGA